MCAKCLSEFCFSLNELETYFNLLLKSTLNQKEKHFCKAFKLNNRFLIMCLTHRQKVKYKKTHRKILFFGWDNIVLYVFGFIYSKWVLRFNEKKKKERGQDFYLPWLALHFFVWIHFCHDYFPSTWRTSFNIFCSAGLLIWAYLNILKFFNNIELSHLIRIHIQCMFPFFLLNL